MNILYYSWGELSSDDICDTFNSLGYNYKKFTHTIQNYEQDSAFENALYQLLSNESFDCIFTYDYFPTISNVARDLNIKYISWIYDCPHYTLYSSTIHNDCNEIFFFDKLQYAQFVAIGLKNAHYMPLAANVDRFNNILGNDISQTAYNYDISFVGTMYENSPLTQVKNISDYAKGYIDALISAQKNVSGYNFIADSLSESFIDELNKTIAFNNSAITIPNNIIYSDFINKKLTSDERITFIDNLSKEFRVDLFTNSSNVNLTNTIKHAPISYRDEMPHIFRSSKINLNITLRSITSGIPLRAIDIMGCGGFLLSNYQPELDELFVNGEELVLFDGIYDLIEKARYYLEHEEDRLKIAIKGHEKVCKLFEYKKTLATILESFYLGK